MVDINIYNGYLYCSRGLHPTFEQYQNFAYNVYYHRYLNMMQSNLLPKQIQNQLIVHEVLPIQNEKIVCIRGMKCKNIKCKDFHHPSKDLDILNEFRK